MPKLQKKEKVTPLFEGISPKRRTRKIQVDTEWSAKALKSQGDILFNVIVPMMKAADITRISIEGMDRALVKAHHNFMPHHIRAAIKDLVSRELMARDGQTYYITKKGLNETS